MSQRRDPRRPRPRRQPGSKVPLVLSSAILVVVVAIVVFLVVDASNGSGSTDPTPTATTVAAASPSSTPTAQGTGTPTTPLSEIPSTPVPTESPEITATSVPSPTGTAAQPTPTPAAGEFGDLPPALASSGNSAGRPLNFDYHLNMSLQLIPSQAPAYQFQHRSWTLEQVQTLAQSLGITGDVTNQGSGTFQASGNGSLYVSGDVVQYVGGASATPVAGPMPEDSFLIDSARSWLVKHQLAGADAGQGSIANRNEGTGRALVVIKPVEPTPILSATPSAALNVAADGSVVEANIQWPAALQSSNYGLRDPNDLWSDVTSGRAYVEIDGSQLPSGSVSGTVTVTSSSLAYTIAGSPAAKQFLVPLVVFEGQAQVGDASIPVKIYVPAVSAQVAPRG